LPFVCGRLGRVFDHLGAGHIRLEHAEVVETAAAVHLRWRVVAR
jgi:hypothetical protein